MTVYECILQIQAALAKTGVAKDRKTTGAVSFNYRGIDEMLEALAPLLAESKLIITPYLQERTCTEYQSKQGGSLFNTCVVVDYHLISVEDQTPHVVRVPGEAMDSGDKGTNKAMSSAYKNMAIQTFCIPTVGATDSETQTHEVASKGSAFKPPSKPAAQQQQPAATGEAMPMCPGCGVDSSVRRSKFANKPAFVCFGGKGGCGTEFDLPLPTASEDLDAIFASEDEIEF